MKKLQFEKEFRNHFPTLIKYMHIDYKTYEYNGEIIDYCTISVPFSDKRISVWISSEEDGIIVGINELHNHFDLYESQQNR